MMIIMIENQSIRDFFHNADADLPPEKFKYFLFFNCRNKDEAFDDGTNILHALVTKYGSLKLSMAAVEEGELKQSS